MNRLILLLVLTAAVYASLTKDKVWDQIVEALDEKGAGDWGDIRNSLDKDLRNASFRNEDMGYDDLTTVEILMELEEKLHIEIPDEDAVGLKTFAQIRDYIYNKLKNGD